MTHNPRIRNLKGERYGHLVVEELTDERRSGSAVWLCRCDCGRLKPVSAINLRIGHAVTCGCRMARTEPPEPSNRDPEVFDRIDAAIAAGIEEPQFQLLGGRVVPVNINESRVA